MGAPTLMLKATGQDAEIHARKSPKEDDVFAYSIQRAAPSRHRTIKMHDRSGVVEVKCRAGATCSEVLERFEQLTSPLPLHVQVFRVPPKAEVRTNEYEEWVERVLRVLSPIAPPLSVFRGNATDLDDDLVILLSRAEDPLDMRHRIGTRTTDLWVQS